MPIYKYECESCGEVYSDLVSSSAPHPPCPTCNSEQVHRLITPSAFHLKGSGWYVTDYKGGAPASGDSASASESAPASASESSDSTSESSSESTDSSSSSSSSESSSTSSTSSDAA